MDRPEDAAKKGKGEKKPETEKGKGKGASKGAPRRVNLGQSDGYVETDGLFINFHQNN